MLCPHCNSEIKHQKDRIFYCPYCTSILDDELRKISQPNTDKNGYWVEEYDRNPHKVGNFGKNEYTRIKKAMSPLNKLIIFIASITFGLPLIIFGIYYILNPVWIPTIFGGIFAIILGLVCLIPIIPTKHDIYEEIDYPDGIPIRYYGNQSIFGYATIPIRSNDSEALPKVEFFEFNRADIESVLYDEQYIIVELKKGFFVIPNIFHTIPIQEPEK